MPFLDIGPSQVNIQLSSTLGGMPQDLLKYGRRATRLNPERSSGVAEEVGGDLDSSFLPYPLKYALYPFHRQRLTIRLAIYAPFFG